MKACNLISIGVLPIFVVGSVLCAPQNSQQVKQATLPLSTVSSQQQSTTQSTTSSAPSSTTVLSTTGSSADRLNPSVSQANLASNNDHSEQASQQETANNQAFDAKNLFADDSLWQIPIHLVRDLSTAADGNRNDGHSVASKVAPDVAASNAEIAADNAGADEADQADEPTSYSDKQSLMSPSASQSASRVSSSDDEQSSSSSPDLKTAAGYNYPSSSHGSRPEAQYGAGGSDHYHGMGKYFQYASVPKPYTWESGYRRGNPYHTIERHEQAKGPHYHGKVKWSDKHAGSGVHVYDYNHGDHYSHHNQHHDDHYEEKHAPKHEAHNEGGHHGHKRHTGYQH